MPEFVVLEAADGFKSQAYVARPDGKAKAALIVVQEIFGVNKHMKEVCERWADDGYIAIAPQYFDRVERNFEAGYDVEGFARGKEVSSKLSFDDVTADTTAAVAWLRENTELSIGIVGYCFGGTAAWLGATRVGGIRAAVGYYGRLIGQFLDEKPRCPVMLHFGKEDLSIPAELVDKIEAAHPEVTVYRYEKAGHAFDRFSDPHAYRPEAAALALDRTKTFFAQHLGFAK
ncbi:MAG: dienelactone hydrolase family protein [Acidobacteria bacterium]|nr:dienelactone hydrolase family protein [Acidobacteriota bacterium]